MRLKEFALSGLIMGTALITSASAQTSPPSPPSENAALAAAQPASANAPVMTGAPVTFRFGRDMNEFEMRAMAEGVNRDGCPVERATADGPPGRI